MGAGKLFDEHLVMKSPLDEGAVKFQVRRSVTLAKNLSWNQSSHTILNLFIGLARPAQERCPTIITI